MHQWKVESTPGRNGFATLTECRDTHSQIKDKAVTDCSRKQGTSVRADAHQLRQDKHQDMRQKKQKLTSASYSDRCAAVCIIPFVSTMLLSLRHVADIVS
jgi:hypothetical protein